MTYQPPQDPYPHRSPGGAPVPPHQPPTGARPSNPVPMAAANAPAPSGRRRLGPGQRAAAYVGSGALVLLLLVCGGAGIISAATSSESEPSSERPPVQTTAPAAPQTSAPTAPQTSAPAAPTTAAQPVITKQTKTETQSISFAKKTVKDSSLDEGEQRVRTRGVPGVKTLTYEVTLTNGVQTAKRLVRSVVTKKPVTQVTAIGTKKSRQCDENYSGCVPIASDVDCAGGSGNGPAYVDGPIRVIGDDVYDLDRDGDGTACED